MEKSVLEDLGLSSIEITTYTTLLELGSSHAGSILEKSGLQNSSMHRALNSLIEKGLINFILDGKRKVYQATDPEQFYHFIDEKRRKFSELLPELKAKQQLATSKENASVYKGKRGIIESYYRMINVPGVEYNTYGGGPPCADLMGVSWWENLHKKRVDNNLPSRQVFDLSVKSQAEGIESNPLTQTRYLSAEFAQFQEIVIVGDHIAINVFTENPYAIIIQDQMVADGYRQHFELLWSIAKP